MLYPISVTERGLTGIANIFRSRLSRLDDLLGAGTVPLNGVQNCRNTEQLYSVVTVGAKITYEIFIYCFCQSSWNAVSFPRHTKTQAL